MAPICKKLIHFKNKENFIDEVANDNILETSISFIQDSKEINTHHSYYKTVAWSIIESDFIKSADAVAGDVWFYDSKDAKTVICPKSLISEQDTDRFIPIGVIVIPGSHDVYGNGHCGIMSLRAMNCSTPSAGSTGNQGMCAGNNVDYPTPNYNQVPVYENGALVGKGFGYLAKDGQYASTTYRIPDPYNPDGSRNPDYYTTSVARNAMGDFSGEKSTASVIEMRGAKDYSSWNPTPSTKTDFPAYSCCDMFFTPGTSQGDWYLPAMGEIGYLMARWSEILNSVEILNSMYGPVASPIVNGDCFWSCTEHTTANLRYVHTANGAGHSAKTTATYYVKAFTTI